ncbi:MAG: hypothetical protein LBR40_02010 [Bacilli bacterium]|nr:hypothetical protein [Bacilli bacterium]
MMKAIIEKLPISILDTFKLSNKDIMHQIYDLYKDKRDCYIDEDNYLFIGGQDPVCFVTHFDTKHKFLPKEIKRDKLYGVTKYSSPTGIGANGRSGVIALLYFLETTNCSALFTLGNQNGELGAKAFVTSEAFHKYQDKINIWIEWARKGSNDYKTYNYHNDEVTKIMNEAKFYLPDHSSHSDVEVLAQASGVIGINISCGYYKMNFKDEYFISEILLTNIQRIEKILGELSKEKRNCVYKSDE